MIEVQDGFQEISNINSNQPNLLVLQKATWSMIKSIFAQSWTEIDFEFSNHCIMHVENILSIIIIDFHI